MKRVLAILGGGVLLVALGGAFYIWNLEDSAGQPAFYESAIMRFEKSDAESFPEPHNIVFVGSSSIRFWFALAYDMAPLKIIRRGFGGAHMEHVLYNFERIVSPYEPQAVVTFVGGNDIGSGKGADILIRDYQQFVEKMQRHLPEADLWMLAMKPSKLRWELREEMDKVDVALRKVAAENPKIYFVETGKTLLNSDGEPDNVYIFDGLHLNSEGYRRWTELLKPLLLEAYPVAGP